MPLRIRVLTVTTSQQRLANPKAVTERAGGGVMFWFTTFDLGNAENALSAPFWRMAGREGHTTPGLAQPSRSRQSARRWHGKSGTSHQWKGGLSSGCRTRTTVVSARKALAILEYTTDARLFMHLKSNCNGAIALQPVT